MRLNILTIVLFACETCSIGVTFLVLSAVPPPKDEEATNVVCLANLLTDEELADEEEASDVLDDTRDKCETVRNFGAPLFECGIVVKELDFEAEADTNLYIMCAFHDVTPFLFSLA